MKKKDNIEIDNALNDFPDNLAKLIKASLDTKNSGKKLSARNTLVRMGKTTIRNMHKLLTSENALLRREAAKIVELIADSRSIPVLIRLLDDKEFEIRWIAAEGLIKIGRKSIRPLLKSVRDGESSLFQNKGVHQVLESLLYETEKKKLALLLLVLEDYHELGETAPMEASKALKSVFKPND